MNIFERTLFFIRENLRLLIGLVVVILIFILIVSLIVNSSDKKVAAVKLNNQVFKVKIAKTDQEKQIGLSNTKRLSKNEGMLFLFSNPGYYSFWMREMKFPIDIIYINGNKVTTIIKNAIPPSEDTSLTTFQPKEKSDKVLEVNAGLADKYNIQEGTTIQIENL